MTRMDTLPILTRFGAEKSRKVKKKIQSLNFRRWFCSTQNFENRFLPKKSDVFSLEIFPEFEYGYFVKFSAKRGLRNLTLDGVNFNWRGRMGADTLLVKFRRGGYRGGYFFNSFALLTSVLDLGSRPLSGTPPSYAPECTDTVSSVKATFTRESMLTSEHSLLLISDDTLLRYFLRLCYQPSYIYRFITLARSTDINVLYVWILVMKVGKLVCEG